MSDGRDDDPESLEGIEVPSEGALFAPTGLKRSVKKAEKVGKDRGRVAELLAEAGDKAARSRNKLGDAWGQLQTLFRLLKAWLTGQYKQVPWRVIVLSLAAVLYFVNPIDIIPDFLGIGFLDDIGVIALVMSQLRQDLDLFRAWEASMRVGDAPEM